MDKAYIKSRKDVDIDGSKVYTVDCYRGSKKIITRSTRDYFEMVEMIGYYEALFTVPMFKMHLQESVICDS